MFAGFGALAEPLEQTVKNPHFALYMAVFFQINPYRNISLSPLPGYRQSVYILPLYAESNQPVS
jgi:hypothetical protein